jgi:hypothetical protein
MSFSLPRFVRRTSPDSLEGYFAERGFPGFDKIDWTSKTGALVTRVRQAADALPEASRSRLLDDFERVEQLCDEGGQTALQDAVRDDAKLLARLRACDGDEARGLLVLLNNSGSFDQALAAAFVDRQRLGRSWSSFRVSAPVAPQNTGPNLRALERYIGGIFQRFDGSGRKLRIDPPFERHTRSSGVDTHKST